MITKEEIIKLLKNVDDNTPVAIAIKYNQLISLYHDIEVEGIKRGDMLYLIISSQTINEEYETLFDGGNIDEEKDYC